MGTDTTTGSRYSIPVVTFLEHLVVKELQTGSSTIPGASALTLWASSTSVTKRITEFRSSRATEHLWPSLAARETDLDSWNTRTTSQSATTTESSSRTPTTIVYKYLTSTGRF